MEIIWGNNKVRKITERAETAAADSMQEKVRSEQGIFQYLLPTEYIYIYICVCV